LSAIWIARFKEEAVDFMRDCVTESLARDERGKGSQRRRGWVPECEERRQGSVRRRLQGQCCQGSRTLRQRREHRWRRRSDDKNRVDEEQEERRGARREEQDLSKLFMIKEPWFAVNSILCPMHGTVEMSSGTIPCRRMREGGGEETGTNDGQVGIGNALDGIQHDFHPFLF
jgi:hypothetical protein